MMKIDVFCSARPQKIYLICFGFLVLLFGQRVCLAQWVNLPLPTNTKELYDVVFVDGQIGYSVGFQSTVIKTIDAGATWIKQTPPAGAYRSPVFFGSDTGFAAGSFSFVLRTYDGGLNWTKQPVAGTSQNYGLCFPTRMRGYMVGDSGRIVRTLDGGTTWPPMISGIPNHLRAVQFIHPDTGYVVADSGKVLRTNDGGLTWVERSIATSETMRALYFFSADTGFVVGQAGLFYKTTNGGINWSQVLFGTTDPFVSPVFTDRNTGYMATLTKIFKTVNGGDTWVEIGDLGQANVIRDIYFLPSGVGYAVGRTIAGAKGFVYKYTPQVAVRPNLQPIVFPLYPNPGCGLYSLENEKGGTLYIYNGLGRLCRTLMLLPGSNRVDMQDLGKGVYTLQTKTAEGVSALRVVVE